MDRRLRVEEIVNSTYSSVIVRILKKENLQDLLLDMTKFLDTEYGDVSTSQRYYHIKKSLYEIQKCEICQKNKAKYTSGFHGYTACSKECSRIKIEKTCLEKYGSITALNTPESKKKAKLTSMEKYGVDKPSKSKIVRDKMKLTCIEKYGVENFSKTDQFLEKMKKTNSEKYGIDHPSKLESKRAEISEKLRNRSDSEKLEANRKKFETNLKKYGSEHYLLSNEYMTNYDEQRYDNIKQRLGENYDVRGSTNSTFNIFHIICGFTFTIPKSTSYRRLLNGHEPCPNCNPIEKSYSKGEKELLSCISEIYSGEIIENTKRIISPYEVDIFLPEFNLAIDYNGLYWHSDAKVNNDYHVKKQFTAEKKGISLIYIWEDWWYHKRNIVESVLKNKLGLSEKIYARKCKISATKSKDERDFFNENHIQGYSNSSVCYALTFDDEIVLSMSFSKTKNDGEWKVEKLASRAGVVVIGGTEKLFKYFLNSHNPSTISTYSLNDLFDGKIYEKLGFRFGGMTEPSYFYSKGYERFNRLQFQKHKLVNIGHDASKTEKEIMNELGYKVIYNSGNKRWFWGK